MLIVRLSAPLALALLVTAPTAAWAAPNTCPGYAAEGSNSRDLDRYYARAALEIVGAAAQADATLLQRRIADDVEVRVWNGDSGIGGNGALGLMQVLQIARLRSYRHWTANSGPISTLAPAICEHETKISFTTATAGELLELRFRFVDGRLARVEGAIGRMEEGTLAPAVNERRAAPND